jgi:hypothetical protein
MIEVGFFRMKTGRRENALSRAHEMKNGWQASGGGTAAPEQRI